MDKNKNLFNMLWTAATILCVVLSVFSLLFAALAKQSDAEAAGVGNSAVTASAGKAPVIKTQPKNQSVAEGQEAAFTVKANRAAEYQWYYQKPGESDWTAVKTNGDAATYTLTAAARHNGYQYKCVVANEKGSVESKAATLKVTAPGEPVETIRPETEPGTPVITTQPESVTVREGETATFTVEADGATAYKWYYLKPGEGDWTAVKTNGDAATYTLTTAARHNGYQYKCVVTNDAGTTETETVTLTVE